MKAHAWLGLVAAAFVVLGCVFGFTAVQSQGFDCGSAFNANDALSSDVLADELRGGTGFNACDEARSARLPFAASGIAIGALVALAAVVVAPRRPSAG